MIRIEWEAKRYDETQESVFVVSQKHDSEEGSALQLRASLRTYPWPHGSSTPKHAPSVPLMYSLMEDSVILLAPSAASRATPCMANGFGPAGFSLASLDGFFAAERLDLVGTKGGGLEKFVQTFAISAAPDRAASIGSKRPSRLLCCGRGLCPRAAKSASIGSYGAIDCVKDVDASSGIGRQPPSSAMGVSPRHLSCETRVEAAVGNCRSLA